MATNENHNCVRAIILQKLNSLLNESLNTVNIYCTVALFDLWADILRIWYSNGLHTGWTRNWFHFLAEARDSFPLNRPTQPPIRCVLGGSFPRVEAVEEWSFSAEVMNGGAISLFPPYVFKIHITIQGQHDSTAQHQSRRTVSGISTELDLYWGWRLPELHPRLATW